jgi:hypothetical protein
MSLVYCDGFDSYASGTTDLAYKYYISLSASPSINCFDGYKTGKAVQIGYGSKYQDDGIWTRTYVPRSGIYGCWFNATKDLTFLTAGQGYGSDFGIGSSYNIDRYHLTFHINKDNFVEIHYNVADSYATSTIIVLNTWYHLEFSYQITGSTTLPCIFKLNGIEIARLPIGTNTYNNTYLYAGNIEAFYQPLHEVLFDHFYILNLSGTTNNTFLGPGMYVRDLHPISDSATQWMPGTGTNWDRVADETTHPITSDNIYTSFSGNTDLYNMSSLTGNIKNIVGVQNNVFAMQSGVDKLSIKSACKIDGTTYTDIVTTGEYLAPTITYYNNVLETNPATLSAWTTGELASTKFGFQLWHTGLGAGA